MTEQTNPAARLLSLVEFLKGQRGVSVIEAVCAFDGIDPSHETAALSYIGDLHKLLTDVEAKLHTFVPEYADLCDQTLKKLRRLLGHKNLNAAINKGELDQALMLGLKVADRHLSQIEGVAKLEVDPDEVKQLADDAWELLTAVQTSALPLRAKIMLSDELEKIVTGLGRYRLNGVDGLEEVLARAAGNLSVRWQELRGSGEEGKDTVDQISSVLDRLRRLVALANGIKDLQLPWIEWLKQLPPPGGS